MSEVRCKSCGAKMEFLENRVTGKKIPAQRVRTIYRAYGNGKIEPIAELSNVFISHFETCPQAGLFSKKPAKPEAC